MVYETHVAGSTVDQGGSCFARECGIRFGHKPDFQADISQLASTAAFRSLLRTCEPSHNRDGFGWVMMTGKNSSY